MSNVVAATPYYVLRDENRHVGPHVLPSYAELDCAPIYGFSTAGAYHLFRQKCEELLTPYPLVKVYLRARIGASGAEPKLVVLDAIGPREPHLRAATVEAVLEAQENRTTHLSAGYQLDFDQEAGAYRVEAVAS